MKKTLFFVGLCLLLLNACSPAPARTPTRPPTDAPTATQTPLPLPPLALTSSAFAAGQAIPEKFTCNGENVSPPLAWNEPPAATQSFALVVDDLDYGSFVHWVLYNIPAKYRSLSETGEAGQTLKDGLMQGANGMGGLEYMGSCPPPGSAHHYSFRLYALDAHLDRLVFDKDTLVSAMEGHILAQSELIGTYAPK